MTRLRFLLVSLFTGVAACLGIDRERLARRWLRTNGFVIAEYERRYIGSPELTHYRVVITHSKLGVSGGRARSSMEPITDSAASYVDWLARHDFTIEELHETISFVSRGENNGWNDVEAVATQIAPPTIHRFSRPWWV